VSRRGQRYNPEAYRKADDAMTETAAEELRANLVGAWTLESYESRSLDGSGVTYPLGPDAQGIIMYTPDGYMSAQLMRQVEHRSTATIFIRQRRNSLRPPVDTSLTRGPTPSSTMP
jgi:hypothetical protein